MIATAVVVHRSITSEPREAIGADRRLDAGETEEGAGAWGSP